MSVPIPKLVAVTMPAVVTPVIFKLSSIMVRPVAESIVKSPDDVSISLLPVTPICILSIAAPPFASIKPVNVEEPATSKLPFASIAPAKVAPADTFTSSSSVVPSTSRVPAKSIFPFAIIFPVRVDTPDTDKSVANALVSVPIPDTFN